MLDALLRARVTVPYSCRAGVCNSCLMQAEDPATVPTEAQQGLKDAWKAAGCFLACLCRPDGDFAAQPAGAGIRVSAVIEAVAKLSATVLGVRLRPGAEFAYRAGQYLTLFRPDGLARSFSIASLPTDGAVELHVRILPGGAMSGWLATEPIGETVEIQGPAGDCFYVAGRDEQPLLLVGTGTGLAPLLGILRDAIAAGHRGPIHLIHGASTRANLYLTDTLRDMSGGAISYTATTLDEDGPVDALVRARHPKVAGWRAFLCGDPGVVQTLRKQLFLAGAALGDIHADAFLPSATIAAGAA